MARVAEIGMLLLPEAGRGKGRILPSSLRRERGRARHLDFDSQTDFDLRPPELGQNKFLLF